MANAPIPLPATRIPCAAFTPDADYIEQALIMQLEGREIGLRIPRVFLEDVWDLRPGFKDTAQLFQVEIGSFIPVSRAETGSRNKRGIWNWMHFVITDWIPLEEIAEYGVEKDVITLRVAPTFPDLTRGAGPYGLVALGRGDGLPLPPHQREVFVNLSPNGDLNAVLTCDTPQRANYPICLHYFRASGMDVELSYRRTELPNWQALQDDVTAFAGCLTKANP